MQQKLASDKLFCASNSTDENKNTKFAVVRYGNVMGSRGVNNTIFSVNKGQGELPITDVKMTRFMISLGAAVELVWKAFDDMLGGEIYVKKIPSMKITDITRAIAPDSNIKIIGIRPGEKLHEQMISCEDAPHTFEYNDFFKILPAINNWSSDPKRIGIGMKVPEGFSYASNNNKHWMRVRELRRWLDENIDLIGKY